MLLLLLLFIILYFYFPNIEKKETFEQLFPDAFSGVSKLELKTPPSLLQASNGSAA